MFKILSVSGSSNEVVTNYYMDIIYDACLAEGLEVSYFTNRDKPEKTEYIVVATILDALRYWLRGYKRIIIWIQGVQPEESYMKNSSKVRYKILSFIERYMLQNSSYLFLVSDEMKRHFENKYGIDIAKKCYVMPCFNTEFHPECIIEKTKYEKNVFTYIGSLSVWQCFEETLDIYKKIEDELKDSQLKVFTFSVNEAKEKIISKGIENYSVECVANEHLPKRLKEASYGFVIRDNNVVNLVATPTKLSTYLSCGIIPIFSDCLKSFFEISKSMKYVIPLSDNENDIFKIVDFSKRKVDLKELRVEYENVFKYYYGKDRYIKEIGNLLSSVVSMGANK